MLLAFTVLRVGQSANAQAPIDVAVIEKTPVHVVITNIISIPSAMPSGKILIFNRWPVQTPWNGGPQNVRWSLPGAQIRQDDQLSNSSLRQGASSFQCQAQPSQVMTWEGRWDRLAATPVTSVNCKYDLVLARRIFNAEKYSNLTIDDFDALPKDLQREAVALQKTIDPQISTMARGQIALNPGLIDFVQAASDFCGREVKRGVVDSQGKPIERYDAATSFRERKGWCGPQSSLFRAFCLAVGLPAREVSGFALKRINVVDGEINMSDTRGLPDPNKDGNAHVWAEVYFPNVGWIEINVGSNNCFDIPSTFVRVSGIEAPQIVYLSERSGNSYDSFGPHITVIPE